MNRDNLIIYVSSHNNYDMLEGEILKNIDREGFEFINVDDKSCSEEIEKGKRQGIEVWAITNQDKETFYVLTETMFINFLRLVELNNSKE